MTGTGVASAPPHRWRVRADRLKLHRWRYERLAALPFGKCGYCGIARIRSQRVDHVPPLSVFATRPYAGVTVLVPCCRHCNNDAGADPADCLLERARVIYRAVKVRLDVASVQRRSRLERRGKAGVFRAVCPCRECSALRLARLGVESVSAGPVVAGRGSKRRARSGTDKREPKRQAQRARGV